MKHSQIYQDVVTFIAREPSSSITLELEREKIVAKAFNRPLKLVQKDIAHYRAALAEMSTFLHQNTQTAERP